MLHDDTVYTIYTITVRVTPAADERRREAFDAPQLLLNLAQWS